MAYENRDVGMHAKIFVRVTKEVNGEMMTGKIETSVGRIIFNQGIPQDLGFIDRSKPENEFEYEINGVVSKKNLGKIIGKCISVHGLSRTAELLDYIKSTGYKYSTLGAVTVSIDDVKVPPQKKEIIAKAQADVDNILKQYGRGLITDDERYSCLLYTSPSPRD